MERGGTDREAEKDRNQNNSKWHFIPSFILEKAEVCWIPLYVLIVKQCFCFELQMGNTIIFGLLNLWILPRLHHHLKVNKPIHSENNVWVRSVKIRTKYLSSQILRSLGLSYFCHYSCGFCHSADMNRQAGTPSGRILASATRPSSPFPSHCHHPSSDPYHLAC